MELLRSLSNRFSPALNKARRGDIGVDIGLSALHFVQLGRGADQQFHLHARASAPIDGGYESLSASPQKIRELIRLLLKKAPFSGRRAVVAMPAGQFRTMSINYRPRNQQSDEEAIAQLMTERLDGPLHDYVIDCIPVRSTARDAEKLAIVAVSRREEVMNLLESLHSAGLTVEALEIAPVALRRLANVVTSGPSDMTLMLNTGRQRSYLTLLSGRRLLLDQPLDFGESMLIDTLSSELDLAPDQAMDLLRRTGLHPGSGQLLVGHHEGETGIFNTLLEILRPHFTRLVDQTDQAFMYAAAQTRGGGDARIMLLGALARWPGCDRVLAAMTHLPVTVMPSEMSSFAPFAEGELTTGEPHPEYAVASGLALRGLIDEQ